MKEAEIVKNSTKKYRLLHQNLRRNDQSIQENSHYD